LINYHFVDRRYSTGSVRSTLRYTFLLNLWPSHGKTAVIKMPQPPPAFQHFSISAFQHFSISAFQHFSTSALQHFSTSALRRRLQKYAVVVKAKMY
jgi:hypothetical protein